jgi:mannose-6-phosphate isomerase-like protein (cupin superfamily)
LATLFSFEQSVIFFSENSRQERKKILKMARENDSYNISSTFVVFGSDGEATPIPVTENFFDDLKKQFGDFTGRLLVSHFSFDKDWESWERHPNGEELACLLSGTVQLILKKDDTEKTVWLDVPGSFVLIPRGTWHTAKVPAPSSMLFITYGEGTENRPL